MGNAAANGAFVSMTSGVFASCGMMDTRLMLK